MWLSEVRRYAAFFLVLAAFFAAAERPRAPFVRTAFFAAADREDELRLDAARLAWADSERFEAALVPSRFNARDVARARLALDRLVVARLRLDVDLPVLARLRVDDFLDVDDFLRGTFTPARRALERPMAMACCGERAPCLPSRTCSISSCTYAPACVLGDLP